MIVVLGTREGVGKTLVAMTLLRLADALDIRAAGMKPVQVGCPYSDDHDLWARDGAALRAAVREPLPPLITSPYRFPTHEDPAIAVRRAGLALTLTDLVTAVEEARARTSLLIVEATGGLDTAIAEDGTSLELARRLGGTILVVADDPADVERIATAIPGALVVLTRVEASEDPRVLLALGPLGDGHDPLDAFLAADLGARVLRPALAPTP